MDHAAQYARRAEVLQKTIAKWKDSAPLALARFLDDLGLHQLLLETFPAGHLEAHPEGASPCSRLPSAWGRGTVSRSCSTPPEIRCQNSTNSPTARCSRPTLPTHARQSSGACGGAVRSASSIDSGGPRGNTCRTDMTLAMNALPPAPDELSALLRLLDDETPAVRERVAERLALCGGDISEWLATQARALSHQEKSLLCEMLRPSRREALVHEWIAPTGGAAALQEDWETFEALLRTLSDFLHDGISLRQPLSDALDLLAEEAAEHGITTAIELRKFLFDGSRLVANQGDYYDPKNSDLAWSIANGKSNPLGLCLIYILVGRRLNFEIEGVNFPGHFMCRIFDDGYPIIIDCYDNGQLHVQFTLLESPDLSRAQRNLIRESVGPGSILVRLLNNLHEAFEGESREQDALLIKQLLSTLQ